MRTLKEGYKSKSGPTLEKKLEAAKTRTGYLEHVLNVFNATQSQIEALQSELNAAVSQENNLANQRLRLGIFAGKEKKRIDEELAAVSTKKSDLEAQIKQKQKILGNYSSFADVERDLREARNNANKIEIQIEDARANTNYEYSFEEALNIYLQDSEVTRIVNTVLYPTISRDSIVFGRYIQKNNGTTEPIEWQVLSRENDRILVISRYALDCQEYDDTGKEVTWETCSLRKWLNGTFLNTAFSDSEQVMISNVTVSADKNPEYSTNPGNSTKDRVFLLSITEVKKHFTSDSARQCQGTAYSYAQGAYKASNGNCWWWLRSPGEASSNAAGVSYIGSVVSAYSVDNDYGAVRPALWIELGL